MDIGGAMKRGIGVLVAAWLLVGCTLEAYQPSLISFTYPAADQLVDNLDRNMDQQLRPLRKERPMLVASFVELDNLEKSSTFGRLVAEQMASRMSQKKFVFLELKLRDQLFIKNGDGEFALSRELAKISREQDAQAVLVGTYSVIQDFVYVTARIVRYDGHVYASHDFAIPTRHLMVTVAKGR